MFAKSVKIFSLITLFVAVVIGFPAMFQWGKSVAESTCVSMQEKEATKHLQEMDVLKKAHERQLSDATQQHAKEIEAIKNEHAQEQANLRHQLERCKRTGPFEKEAIADIFVAGHFGNGLNMALATATGKSDWATRQADSIKLAYPGGENWGTWFISVGAPSSQKTERSFIDASRYTKLTLELKGQAGSNIAVALKDTDDPDDGTESRVQLTLRSNDWESYEIALEDFRTADRKRLYVVTSFVFAKQPQTFFVRNIGFR